MQIRLHAGASRQYVSWDVEARARAAGFLVTRCDTFRPQSFPGYRPRNLMGQSGWFEHGETYTFGRRTEQRAHATVPTPARVPSELFLCVERSLQFEVQTHGYRTTTRSNVAVETSIVKAKSGFRGNQSRKHARTVPVVVFKVVHGGLLVPFRNHRGSWRFSGKYIPPVHLSVAWVTR